jgi:hypothetical protein
MNRSKLFLASVLVSIAACTQIKIEVPVNEPVRVQVLGTSRQATYAPGSPQYVRLSQWAVENQSGWGRVYYTPPAGQGLSVSAGALHLQFLETKVLLSTDKGFFEKNVQAIEYSYLAP